MNSFFQETSEARESPYEGRQSKHWRKTWLTDEKLTTPDTAFTSPCMDTNKSPDTCFVNTVPQTALPGLNPDKYPDPRSVTISALIQAMSPMDKVDSCFASTPARPSLTSTAHPNTRDTALTSRASDQSQLPIQNTKITFSETSVTDSSTQVQLSNSFVDEQRYASKKIPGLLTANPGRPSISHSGTGDSFFDSVPKGPRQLSACPRDARAPVLNPWNRSRDQGPTSPWIKTEKSVSPAERIQEVSRPRLTLRIPHKPTGSGNFRSAPQMATHSDIPDLRADAPHTTNSLVPLANQCAPALQAPQCHVPTKVDLLNPAARPFQSNSSGPQAPARRNNHTVMQPAAASHTNSKTWTSNLVVEKERWQRVEECLGRMNLLKSSVVPKTLKDWLAHQGGRADAKKARELRKLNGLVPPPRDPRLPPSGRPVKIEAAFGGKSFEHKNYCAVLVFPSVWARTYEPPVERPDPLWPCVEEMKEEGDERNTSGFRRFPGLPRVPGNDTVQYKLKAIQPFLTFDTIWELPTRKSVEAANEKYSPGETEKMERYLGKSLFDALDCITEDSF